MKISAHMIVKNEERWVWYAIMSIIDYVDEMLIFDTGSTDNTVAVIKTIKNPKIIFKKLKYKNIDGVTHTLARQKMFKSKKHDWVLIVDGDEIWTKKAAQEMRRIIQTEGDNYEFLIRPYLNMIGDIFHFQDHSAGRYQIGDYVGHITIRAVNSKIIPGLHIDNPYPLEGFYDQENILIQNRKPMRAKLTKYPFLHMTHLRRSNTQNNENKVIRRSSKFKYELGHSVPHNFEYPECFYISRPEIVSSPWGGRSWSYVLIAAWQTPLKLLRRRIFYKIPVGAKIILPKHV